MTIESLSLTDPIPDPTGSAKSRFVGSKEVPREGLFLDPNRHHELDIERLTQVLELGEKALVVAGVKAGSHEFGVIDTRAVPHFDAPFLLVSMQDPKEYAGIWPDQRLHVGKNHDSRFTYQRGVSRNHFSLHLSTDEHEEPLGLHLQDSGSTNGTYVSGFELDERHEPTKRGRTLANYTSVFLDRVMKGGNYTPPDEEAPHGRLNGYPIIGDKSRTVRGGVYGTATSELLVVDNEHPFVKEAVDRIVAQLHALKINNPNVDQRTILREITAHVESFMHYDFEKSERLTSPHYGQNGMINLSELIEARVGICRHQNILTALVIEQAVDEHILRGAVGVQRNIMRGEKDSGHAWTTFLDESGHSIIVDTAQDGFVGTRDEANKQGRWNYDVSNSTR